MQHDLYVPISIWPFFSRAVFVHDHPILLTKWLSKIPQSSKFSRGLRPRNPGHATGPPCSNTHASRVQRVVPIQWYVRVRGGPTRGEPSLPTGSTGAAPPYTCGAPLGCVPAAAPTWLTHRVNGWAPTPTAARQRPMGQRSFCIKLSDVLY